MDKSALVKSALASRKKPTEGSAAEESSESTSEAKQEGDKPSTGISAKKKSSTVKAAQAGKDFGKKNVPGKTGFKTVEQKAAKEYGSAEAGKKVAGAIFWKSQKGK